MTASLSLPDGVEVLRPVDDRQASVLTSEALAFVADLQRRLGPGRERILAARAERWQRLRAGERPDFLAETADVRNGDWQVAPAPPALTNRRVEITGPTEAKMLINAFNSGANVFMVDFEDANSPTWANMVTGQANLSGAIEGTLEFTSPEGKEYRLQDQRAVPVVRPRGWHLVERNVLVDGQPISASLFDFGLCFFHNARRLLDKGLGPYFYLPKLEGHLEARLWNDAFNAAQDALGLDRGTIRCTVLIETILAAFEMEEILYELRDHGCALNAGRWDYLFSIIKKFCDRDDLVLPDRNKITMTAPFMSAYTELLVRSCHRRGAHAIGGMAAFIPSRRDEEINKTALAKVNEDKERESKAGFDGTWVAHPDLVPVARKPFDAVLGDRANQVERQRDDVHVTADDLLNFTVPGADVTDEGLRNDVAVGLRYLQAWLTGNGAAGIYNLMEDVATAEIARSQVWQWIQRGRFTEAAVRGVMKEEVDRIRDEARAMGQEDRRLDEAEALFGEVALGRDYVEFLTLPAYSVLE
ncbi:MAG TPA: malate synthase A [Acidimicrobiia bacterium]|nr:malate synthase A [Acidimicrobiia bacterium]